jgi:hypothetical protein
MMRKQSRRGQKPRRTNRSGTTTQAEGLSVRLTHPPVINPQIVHHQRLRFVCKTAGTQLVTYQNLLDTMVVATSATAGYDIFDSVKVKLVEVWAPSTATPAPVTVSVDFPGAAGSASSDAKVYSDTSMGLEPAHIAARPSKLSSSGFWQATGTLVAFRLLAAVVGEVIDVEVSFRNTDVAPVVTQNVLVGATPGQFYYRGLDGQAIAGTNFTPIAAATI